MFDMMNMIGLNPIEPNGMTNYIMNSDETADAILSVFDKAVMEGLTSAEAISYAMEVTKAREEDLTDYDIDRINRKIEAVSNSNFYNGGRF